MADSAQSGLRKNTFRIERTLLQRLPFSKPIPIVMITIPVFQQYIGSEIEKVQAIFMRIVFKRSAEARLISMIEKLNGIQRAIPWNMSEIKIPTGIDFIRAVFPDFDVMVDPTSQIRVSNRPWRLLDAFNNQIDLVEFVLFPRRSADSLSEEALGLIRNALHDFKIATLTPNEQMQDAVTVFQREYIRREEGCCDGVIDWITVLLMNQARLGGWQRSVYYERVNQQTNERSYFVRLGIRPIIPRFNMQADAWLGFPDGNWGGEDSVLPRRPQNDPRSLRRAGCAVAFVANMAFTHRQRLIATGRLPEPAPSVDPVTLEGDPALITPGTIAGVEDYFDVGGVIFWNQPLLAFSPTFPLPPTNGQYRPRRWRENTTTLQIVGESQLAANWLEANLNARQGQFYVAIRVFTSNVFPRATGQHWVGVNEVVMRGDNTFYRISPTSINDRVSGQGGNNNRRNRGWLFSPAPANSGGPHDDPIDIYVPATEVVEYRIFAIPDGE